MAKYSSAAVSAEDELIESLRGLGKFKLSISKENTLELMLRVEAHLDKIEVAVAEVQAVQSRLDAIVQASLAQIRELFKQLKDTA